MDDPTSDLVERLQATIERLERRVEALVQENGQLRDRVEELEQAAARQAAPFRREAKRKVPADEQKRAGRKAGHVGACRAVPDQVDHMVEVQLGSCPHCGGAVHGVREVEQYIEELPPIRPQVTRLITYRGVCDRCGRVRSTHPLQTSLAEGAAKVQLGPRALAISASLQKQQNLTMRKTCRVLKQLLGLRLTPGGLSQSLDRVADRLQNDYEQLTDELRASAAVNTDETSWYVGEPGWWLWTFTTPQTTMYRVDESRGSAVVQDVLGDDYGGVLVSDCLASYNPAPCRKHKCIAHHLRAIRQARDDPTTHDPSHLDDWSSFFKAVMCWHALRPRLDPSVFTAKREYLERRCDELLAQTRDQPGDLRIQNRLRKQRDHLLTCLYEPAAEPTNNRAERQLRPAVIARKLSCGNKTLRGRDTWQILTSLAATCHQRSINFLDYLTAHLSPTPQPG